jgi:hypothetical protein
MPLLFFKFVRLFAGDDFNNTSIVHFRGASTFAGIFSLSGMVFWYLDRMLRKTGQILAAVTLLMLSQVFFSGDAMSQDLEPRRWSHLPTGLNVLGMAGGWTQGDILFDPVLLIEDATFDVYVTGLGYVRTFELFGKSARVDFVVPYASGRWEGLLDGVNTSIRRRGFMDPLVRFSMNLYGAPPLRGKEYIQYRREHPVDTTIGVGVQLQLPFGDYNDQKLINLGHNRLFVRPQLGVLHQRYKWQFELTGSVFLYQNNDKFWNGNELKQDPLWFLQGHVIYTFKPRWWVSVSGGYAYDGHSTVNGVVKSDDWRKRYIAFSVGMPISARQSVKLVYFTSDTHTSTGTNTDALIVAWSINWGGM